MFGDDIFTDVPTGCPENSLTGIYFHFPIVSSSSNISGAAEKSEARFLYHLVRVGVTPSYCCQEPPMSHEVTWAVQPRPRVVW